MYCYEISSFKYFVVVLFYVLYIKYENENVNRKMCYFVLNVVHCLKYSFYFMHQFYESTFRRIWGTPSGAISNLLDSDIVVCEFKPQSVYSLEKGND